MMIPRKQHQWPTLLIIGTVLSSVLSGCGHTPVTSLYKLSKVNSKTTKLEKLRVAVQIPREFAISDKGVVLVATLQATDSQPTEVEIFELQRLPMARGSAELEKYAASGTHFYRYRIAPQDVQRFEKLRTLQGGRDKKSKRRGSISVAANICRSHKADTESIPISTFLKTSETKVYVPLTLDVDLLEELTDSNLDRVAPLCT